MRGLICVAVVVLLTACGPAEYGYDGYESYGYGRARPEPVACDRHGCWYRMPGHRSRHYYRRLGAVAP